VITLFTASRSRFNWAKVSCSIGGRKSCGQATLYANNEVIYRARPSDSNTAPARAAWSVEYYLEWRMPTAFDNDVRVVTVVQPEPQRQHHQVQRRSSGSGLSPDSVWLTGAVNIRWEIGGGEVTEVRLTANDVLLTDDPPPPAIPHAEAVGTVEYKIWARGPGGEAEASRPRAW